MVGIMAYQLQAKLIAWTEIVGSTVQFILLFIVVSFRVHEKISTATMSVEELTEFKEMERIARMHPEYPHWADNDTTWLPERDNFCEKVGFMAPSSFYLFSEVVLGCYLLQAAKAMNFKKLHTWFNVTATYAFVLIVILIPAFLFYTKSVISITLGAQIVLLKLFFTAYSLIAVHQLKNEIKMKPIKTFTIQPNYQIGFMNSNYEYFVEMSLADGAAAAAEQREENGNEQDKSTQQ